MSEVRCAVVHVAESTARYSRMKDVIGQPPLFQPIRLSRTLVELMLVKSSCSLANWGSGGRREMGGQVLNGVLREQEKNRF